MSDLLRNSRFDVLKNKSKNQKKIPKSKKKVERMVIKEEEGWISKKKSENTTFDIDNNESFPVLRINNVNVQNQIKKEKRLNYRKNIYLERKIKSSITYSNKIQHEKPETVSSLDINIKRDALLHVKINESVRELNRINQENLREYSDPENEDLLYNSGYSSSDDEEWSNALLNEDSDEYDDFSEEEEEEIGASYYW
jgi:hypothetical protein